MTLADFLSNQLQMTEEQFDQQCPAVIKQSMVQELLLKAVAESENMEISDEEYEAGIEKYVKSTGAESKETLLSQYTEAEIRRSLIMDKALDFLKENTTVKVEGRGRERDFFLKQRQLLKQRALLKQRQLLKQRALLKQRQFLKQRRR